MTPKAAEAFAAYVGMGPGRSLRSLASILVEQGLYKNSTAALRVLGEWSSRYRWQERLSSAITAQTEAAIAKAAEIDAKSFLRTSELIAKRLSYTDHGHIDAVLRIRDSVRRPATKGTGDAVANVSVTLRLVVDRLAAARGLDAEEAIAEAQAILAEAS